MDLFENHRARQIAAEAPLAARMRPRTLDEFVGQDQIVGPGRLLRRAIQADQLSSLIFSGPPGTGKTTLAQIIANTTRAHFIAINAVLAGVKEIRAAIEEAQQRRGNQGQRTILFVDEVHRFNKAQQDALLPWVENGTLLLIGATTENPYFEVNKALVSRSRIFQLKGLDDEDLRRVVHQALADPERGYGRKQVQIDTDALEHLIAVANGDARSLLNALELAVETTPPDEAGSVRISLGVAEESIQRRAVLYDREGDAHFDTISAYIKSLRGSDPDAALYWLARMIYAGEDPHFIFRRLLIQASEDIGLADPQALGVVEACASAFDRVGMPEGRYHLAQATLYLATAPKSNSTMAFFDALAAVEREGRAEVPTPLKDASRDKQGFGHGAGYLYPHAYRDHWVAQQYLPAALQGQLFYQPSDQGYEAGIRQTVERRREAQLAALTDGPVAPPEVWIAGPLDRAAERWLARTLSRSSEDLARQRDHLVALAEIEGHHVVLDLNAGSGLLTWELVRRAREGGVWAAVRNETEREALVEQAEVLDPLRRPQVFVGQELATALSEFAPDVHFDRMLGRNVLTRCADRAAVLAGLTALLRPGGSIVLAETVPRRTQRLYEFVAVFKPEEALFARLCTAEEAIYGDPNDPLVNWDVADLEDACVRAGLRAEVSIEQVCTEMEITRFQIERWFSKGEGKLSYADRLRKSFSAVEMVGVQGLFERLSGRDPVLWKTTVAFLRIQPGQ